MWETVKQKLFNLKATSSLKVSEEKMRSSHKKRRLLSEFYIDFVSHDPTDSYQTSNTENFSEDTDYNLICGDFFGQTHNTIVKEKLYFSSEKDFDLTPDVSFNQFIEELYSSGDWEHYLLAQKLHKEFLNSLFNQVCEINNEEYRHHRKQVKKLRKIIGFVKNKLIKFLGANDWYSCRLISNYQYSYSNNDDPHLIYVELDKLGLMSLLFSYEKRISTRYG